MTDSLEPERLRSLIDLGGIITSELDLDTVLRRVLEAACQLTGAQYAALGVLNEERTELERFVTRGIDEDAARTIGDLPRGRGVLGVLIDHPEPLRLASVGAHPNSYGFPSGHPPMDSFLGVPILIRAEAWGNLYLTQKLDGEFTEADEEAIVVLARWAGIAVENARLHGAASVRRAELERAVRGLEATQAIALAVGGETEVDRVLELIVKRGRALVTARSLMILLRQGDELVVAASAGHTRHEHEIRVPVEGSTSGQVMEAGRPQRVQDVARLEVAAENLGVDGATTALITPLAHRGHSLGVLVAFDRGEDASPFTDEDEQTLKAFAAFAATAVATAQSVQQQRLRDAMASVEAERRHWAQELHDETLQALGGLRVLLSAARRSPRPDALDEAVEQGIAQIEQEITNLRAIITELRPAALDELGLVPALEALFERHQTVNDLDIVSELDVPPGAPLGPDLEAVVYRVVQEALTNVAKHAHARRVAVAARVEMTCLVLEISDDGCGFDVDPARAGFGLKGMRERVLLSGGDITISSSERGTTVRAEVPVAEAQAPPPLRIGSTPRLRT